MQVTTMKEYLKKHPEAPEWVKEWAGERFREINSVRCQVFVLSQHQDEQLMKLPYETIAALEDMKS